jgi:hypothetical protein
MLQEYVSSVSEVCFICIFRTHVASVFIWMLHMFHTYVACVLIGSCIWLQWFSSVFRCFFKCFRSMFQVFQLSSDVCCNCCIWIKSRSGVASLLPTFCCIVSPGVSRASIRLRGRVLPNRRHHAPFPSCRLGGAGPAWSSKRSAMCGRPSRHPGASTSVN